MASEWEKSWNPEDIKGRIEKLREAFLAAKEYKKRLGVDGRGWKKNGDLRFRVFNHIINTIIVADISSHHTLAMIRDDFWKKQKHLTDKDKRMMTEEYDRANFRTFFFEIFISIEFFFRAALKAVDPSACKEATANFKCVYDTLLGKTSYHYHLPDVLNLYRTMRNGLHNNFIHTGDDDTLSYKGVDYEFKKGQPIEHFGWGLIIDMTITITQSLGELVQSMPIVAVPSIPDPYDNFYLTS